MNRYFRNVAYRSAIVCMFFVLFAGESVWLNIILMTMHSVQMTFSVGVLSVSFLWISIAMIEVLFRTQSHPLNFVFKSYCNPFDTSSLVFYFFFVQVLSICDRKTMMVYIFICVVVLRLDVIMDSLKLFDRIWAGIFASCLYSFTFSVNIFKFALIIMVIRVLWISMYMKLVVSSDFARWTLICFLIKFISFKHVSRTDNQKRITYNVIR